MAYLHLMKDFYRLDESSGKLPRLASSDVISSSNCSLFGFLRIEVRDTGQGMQASDLPKLFHQFSQVSNSAEHQQLGTGLGLWITQNLCLSMGGNIKAYSTYQEGSTFIAVVKSEKRPDIVEMEPQLQETGVNAMVVDDMKTNLDIHICFLKKCNVNVKDVATNGLEAYEIYKKRGNHYFGVIFMDLDMPIMNGEVACEKIRQYEKTHCWDRAILVVITGHCKKENHKKLLDPNGSIQANYVFLKPFSFQICRDLIAEITKNEIMKKKSRL